MPKKLVIVESPAKAKTIAGYLGPDFVVESSVGHIRDLPERASEIPKAERERFGALGVAIDEGFEPYYVVDPDKKRVVAELKRKLKDADELLLATDEDREGEAIAWHLLQELKPKVPARRMVFHEITKQAIQDALEQPAPGRRAAGRLAGDAADPRPALRLRGLARALEEGDAPAVGRPRPVGRDPAGRRARARADGVRLGRVLGHRGQLRPRPASPPGSSRSTASGSRRVATSARTGSAKADAVRQLDESEAPRARRAARRRAVRRPLGRREAVHAPARAPVHDLDAPAGGEPQAPVHGADGDARSPSGSTSAATSPTCAPTRRRCRRRR